MTRYFRSPNGPKGHFTPSEALRAALDQELTAGGDPGEVLIGFLGRTIEALLDNGYLGADRAATIFGTDWQPLPQNKSASP